MTDTDPVPNGTPEALQSPVEPPAPDTPPTPPTLPEPAPEPVEPAPESDPNVDAELNFDDAGTEFAGDPEEHPSRQPVASRPTPAGPSSHPHERVAQARDENR